MMQPHQQRVIDEQASLKEKLDKLLDFLETPLFDSLPAAEQGRLKSQSFFMSGYSDILRQRIEAFAP